MATLTRKSTDAVITVGDGRGFLVAGAGSPARVITAAHCLPHLPQPVSDTDYRRYPKLLGPLGAEPTVAAACLFVDPVADVAVLDRVDGQVFPDDEDAYEALIDQRPTCRVGTVAGRSAAWVLMLDGEWRPCVIDADQWGRGLAIFDQPTQAGMSGSPILNRSGHAVGIVSIGSEANGEPTGEEHGQPALLTRLPGWLLGELLPPSCNVLTAVAAMQRAWERWLRESYEAARQKHGLPKASRTRARGGRQ